MTESTQPSLAPSFKNILFATDFSHCSQLAMPYLRALAELYGATVHVLHVIPPEPMLELPLDTVPELDSDRDVALASMKTMLSDKPFGNNAVTMTARRGPLWPVMEELIHEKHIDLVVLGTHGRRGLKKLVLGSIAEQVFRLASCPVLTVGPQSAREESGPARIASILFATDFSGGSHYALAHAESLARVNHAHLTLLHVVSASMEFIPAGLTVDPTTIEMSQEFVQEDMVAARKKVAEQVSDSVMRELNPEIMVECGPVPETILNLAAARKADLIVMGAHRMAEHSLVSHLPWATVADVVCRAHCPVLTVRN